MENDVSVPNIEYFYFAPKKSNRKTPRLANVNYYRVALYFQVIDMHLKTLNGHFDEVNTDLLLCMDVWVWSTNLHLKNKKEKKKKVHFAKFYLEDDRVDFMNLPIQLDNYNHDTKMHSEFSSLKRIGNKIKRSESYKCVYMLFHWLLGLLVSTATI